MTRDKMKAFLEAVVSLRNVATDEQAIIAAAAYPEWKADVAYEVGARVLYNEVLYKVLTAHTRMVIRVGSSPILHTRKKHTLSFDNVCFFQ